MHIAQVGDDMLIVLFFRQLDEIGIESFQVERLLRSTDRNYVKADVGVVQVACFPPCLGVQLWIIVVWRGSAGQQEDRLSRHLSLNVGIDLPLNVRAMEKPTLPVTPANID